MRKIEIGIRPRAGIAPGAGVNANRPHERAEPELTFRHRPISVLVAVHFKTWEVAAPNTSRTNEKI
jgi:hypothetical protein